MRPPHSAFRPQFIKIGQYLILLQTNLIGWEVIPIYICKLMRSSERPCLKSLDIVHDEFSIGGNVNIKVQSSGPSFRLAAELE